MRASPVWTRYFAPLLTRAGLAAACAFAALVVFARFSAEFNEPGKLKTFDTLALHFFKTYQTPGIHEIMAGLTFFAGPQGQTVVLVLCLAYFAFRRNWTAVWTLALAAVGGAAVVSGLKLAFHRPRPELIFAPLGYSFPSGHSFFALVVYGLTAYFASREQKTQRRRHLVWVVGCILAFLVGFSRVYLGQHYPSDVGAGYSAAFFWAWFCVAVPPLAWRRWEARHRDAQVDENGETVLP